MAGNFSEKALGAEGRTHHFQIGSVDTHHLVAKANARSMGELHYNWAQDAKGSEISEHHTNEMNKHIKQSRQIDRSHKSSRTGEFTSGHRTSVFDVWKQ